MYESYYEYVTSVSVSEASVNYDQDSSGGSVLPLISAAIIVQGQTQTVARCQKWFLTPVGHVSWCKALVQVMIQITFEAFFAPQIIQRCDEVPISPEVLSKTRSTRRCLKRPSVVSPFNQAGFEISKQVFEVSLSDESRVSQDLQARA